MRSGPTSYSPGDFRNCATPAMRTPGSSGRPAAPPLHQAVADYLSAKAEETVTPSWVAAHAGFLAKAIVFFGSSIKLSAITPERVAEFVTWLRRQPTPQGSTYSEQSIRHHLYALSALYRKAQRKGWVARGVNPVSLLERHERPKIGRSNTSFLEVPDAARLLWAAATYRAKPHEPEMQLAYALIGTFLLTGGRQKEVVGLAQSDVRFDVDTITFRPHPWHKGGRLKTAGSERTIPLGPQLQRRPASSCGPASASGPGYFGRPTARPACRPSIMGVR